MIRLTCPLLEGADHGAVTAAVATIVVVELYQDIVKAAGLVLQDCSQVGIRERT